MIIQTHDYSIIQDKVPVLTRMDDGTYINTNCWLNDFNIKSENVENILSGFGYKDNILRSIKQFGHSPMYVPVLMVLTNDNLQTSKFNTGRDVLAVALFLNNGLGRPAWLDFFEVNSKYRRNSTENQIYKKTGESALKSFQHEYIHQGIDGRSTYDALPFYFKYGFQRMDERELYLRWTLQKHL